MRRSMLEGIDKGREGGTEGGRVDKEKEGGVRRREGGREGGHEDTIPSCPRPTFPSTSPHICS